MVLCSPPVLALLRQEFVNCWVLAKDLDAIKARDGSPEVATLCKRLQENYAYPVDSVLVGADLSVLGHVNAHDIGKDPTVTGTAQYVDFLRKGLAAAGRKVVAPAVDAGGAAPRRGLPLRTLVVTPEQPSTSLLDVVRCRGFGQPSLAYHTIDVSAFDGGVLELEVRVGREAIGVTFEICAAVELPGVDPKTKETSITMAPVQTKAVASDGTGKLEHTFGKGDRLGLVVKPAPGGSEGDANAFLVTVKVRRP
jgi:hypothetical protein